MDNSLSWRRTKTAAPTPGAELWLDSTYTAGILKSDGLGGLTSVTNSGDRVHTWQSRPGSGDFAQSGDFGWVEPEYIVNAVNGLPAIKFTAASATAMLVNVNYYDSCTVFAVTKKWGPTPGRVVSANNSNWLMGSWQIYQDQFYFDGWVAGPYTALEDYSVKNYSAVCITGSDPEGRVTQVFNDGVLLGSNGSAQGHPNGLFFGNGGSVAPTERCDAYIAEVLLYRRVLSERERQQTEAYLRDKWLKNFYSYNDNFVEEPQNLSGLYWRDYCSGDITISNQTNEVLAPDGTYSSSKIEVGSLGCGGVASGVRQDFQSQLIKENEIYTASIWARGTIGGEIISFGANDYHLNEATLTNFWQKHQFNFKCQYLGRGFQVLLNSPDSTVYVWEPSLVRGVTPRYTQAKFVGYETNSTKGSWLGVYGTEGYLYPKNFTENYSNLPAYASTTDVLFEAQHQWEASSTNLGALQKADNPSDRVLSCWYSSNTFYVVANITDKKYHKVSLYFYDPDAYRKCFVYIVDDETHQPIADPHYIDTALYSQGTWLSFNCFGKVRFEITNDNFTTNSVLTGVFFDPKG